VIIVAGHLRVAGADRDLFLERSRQAIELARDAPGCRDFVVAADPLDPERVNVYERWDDPASLHAFRGEGPGDELGAMIVSADVEEFEVRPASPGSE
jgi:quinol monooxygenase YgiN